MKLEAKLKLTTLIIMLMSILICSTPCLAYNKKVTWKSKIAPLKSDKSSIAQKLYIWLNVTNDKEVFDTKELINFTFDNSHWPMLHKFREDVEKDIVEKVKPNGIRLWFDQQSPKTYTGIKAYIDSLLKLDRGMEAKESIKKLWIHAKLKKHETIDLYKNYHQFLKAADAKKRLDYLLWHKRYYEAGYLFPLITLSDKKIARARMALGRLSYKADKRVSELSEKEKLDAGVIYDRAKWRRRKRKTRSAIAMINLQPKNAPYPKLWWKERNILSRRKIEESKFQEAYNIIAGNNLNAETNAYSQAEWLLGWLSLSFINKPQQAYSHFENFYSSVSSAISRSRAAYWLGKTDEILGNRHSAKNWYKLASQFSSTYYGQLASEKIGDSIHKGQFFKDIIFSKDNKSFNNNELVTAIHLLNKYNLNKYNKSLFTKLFHNANTRNDYVLIANLAREVGEKKYIVETNKRVQQNLGIFMFEIGYPELNFKTAKKSDKALIHAITYRESMFDPKVISHAGARGLMQLMPSTAKFIAKKIKNRYIKKHLTTKPEYNVKLGTAYLERLLNKYDNFYPLAIAAYNAGDRNVSKWIKNFGDPRSNKIDIVDWLELIPIYETRNYVQRVMETYYIYNLKFNQKPRTVISFAKMYPSKIRN